MSAVARSASPLDVPALVEIDTLVSGYPWTAKQFLTTCDGSSISVEALVAENAGSVIGFVVFDHVLDEGSIRNIAVHPASQRRGVARSLVEVVLSRLKVVGVKRCLLEVRASNLAAQSLYACLGFESDGLRRNYYRGPTGREDAIMMSLLL